MIEIKLYTKKAKLQRELWQLLETGKELTYYAKGVNGLVNEQHNKMFNDELDQLSKHNYIEDLNDTEYVRLNKYLDKMTIQQLNERIEYFKPIVDIYKKMPDYSRKVAAVVWKLTHYDKCINTYIDKAKNTTNLSYRYEMHKLIAKAKQDKTKLYKQLKTKQPRKSS